ncbi:hypothetical protein CXF64_15335 [Pseudoalteromonas sp. GutCa3]|nr:hypothetical protein CXF75_07570 [Pseudoalteromonas arctica]PKG69563.1 hypothetical protein CXF64_15335 [Pseudoalteromonas sp. GutCa3]
MEYSLSKLFQGQIVFISNRVLRLLYSILVAAIFYSDELFLTFFVLEGVLPIITLLYAYIYNRTNLSFFFLACFILVPIGYVYSVLIIFLIFIGEILSSFYAFGRERKTNQVYECVFNIFALIGVFFAYYLGFEYLLYVLLAATHIRLLVYIYNSPKNLPEVPSYFLYSLLRQVTSLHFRYLLTLVSVGPVFFVIFRVINQIILFVWSYLKSSTKFEWSHHFKINFSIRFVLLLFITFNLLLAAQVFNLFLFNSVLLFTLYVILVFSLLIFELNKANVGS